MIRISAFALLAVGALVQSTPAAAQVAQKTGDPPAFATGTIHGVPQQLLQSQGNNWTPLTSPAFGDVYQLGGSVARSLNDHFYDHLSVRDFGAVCDGNTDDTTALNKAFASGYYVELPPQTCAFYSPLLIGNPYSHIRGSGMWGASELLYKGTGATADLIVIGSNTAPTNTSGVTSTGYQELSDVLIESATKMTAGAAVKSWGTQFIKFQNVALGRQQDAINLWNGFSFNEEDHQEIDGYFISAQNDGVQAFGFGAEPGAGANGGASGPQYEVWVDHGKIGGAHIGVHVGGGIDGVYVDHSILTGNDYDLVVDNALSPHPNQEIIFGSQAFLDFANWDNVLIDDPKCLPTIMCEVSISGPVLHAGVNGTAGVGSGSFAGQAAPANSGNSVHIESYPLGTVVWQSPYTIDYLNAAFLTEDDSTQLYMNPGMHIGTSPGGRSNGMAKYGLISTASGAFKPKTMPSVYAMANVATPISNVALPAFAAGALQYGGSLTDGSWIRSAPNSGATVVVPTTTDHVAIVSANITSLTIQMPTTGLADGQLMRISFPNPTSGLSWTGSTVNSAPSSVNGGTSLLLQWDIYDGVWLRLQ